MAIVQPIGTGSIDRIEGNGASMVILVAMMPILRAACMAKQVCLPLSLGL